MVAKTCQELSTWSLKNHFPEGFFSIKFGSLWENMNRFNFGNKIKILFQYILRCKWGFLLHPQNVNSCQFSMKMSQAVKSFCLKKKSATDIYVNTKKKKKWWETFLHFNRRPPPPKKSNRRSKLIPLMHSNLLLVSYCLHIKIKLLWLYTWTKPWIVLKFICIFTSTENSIFPKMSVTTLFPSHVVFVKDSVCIVYGQGSEHRRHEERAL